MEKVTVSTGEKAPEVGQRTRSRYSSAYSYFIDERNPSDISLRTIEKMERDPELALALKLLKSPLFNASWRIDCPDPRVRAFVTRAYGRIHREFVKSAARALERGFNPHEKVWMRAPAFDVEGKDETGAPETYRFENAFIYEKIKEVHPESVTIIKKDDRFAGFRQSVAGKSVTVDPEKAVVAVWDERDGNKYGRSVFVGAFDDWRKDRAHAGHMMMYLERKAAPSLVVEYPAGRTLQPDGTEKDNGEIALEIGTSIQNNSAIALPSDLDPETRENRWKITYLKDDARAESFANIHTAVFVPAKLRALFIPDLAAVKSDASGGGAYALGRVHKSVLTDIREDVVEWYVRLVNGHVLPDLVRFNFGAGAPRAEFVIQGLNDNTKDLWVEIVRELAKDPEFTRQVDARELLDGVGIPVAREEEKDLSMKDTKDKKEREEAVKPLPDGLEKVIARQEENLAVQVGRIWRRRPEPEERLREIERLRLRYGGAYESALFRGLGGADGGTAGGTGTADAAALTPRARAELLVDAKKMAASHLARLESEVKRSLIASAAGGAGEEDAIRGLRAAFDRFRSGDCGMKQLRNGECGLRIGKIRKSEIRN
ncbi:MAG: hypothetical protein ABIH66_06850 [bacterium]